MCGSVAVDVVADRRCRPSDGVGVEIQSWGNESSPGRTACQWRFRPEIVSCVVPLPQLDHNRATQVDQLSERQDSGVACPRVITVLRLMSTRSSVRVPFIADGSEFFANPESGQIKRLG